MSGLTYLVEDLLDELVVEPAGLLHGRALHGEERREDPARGGAADDVEEVVHLIDYKQKKAMPRCVSG